MIVEVDVKVRQNATSRNVVTEEGTATAAHSSGAEGHVEVNDQLTATLE